MQHHRVSTLELFFDLVFVFTVTQLTVLIANNIEWRSVGQAVLLFTVLYWMYGGYAHLTNQLPLLSNARRMLLIAAMGSFLVCALAIPKAFDGHGIIFGLGYFMVTVIHGAMYSMVHGPRVLWFAVPNLLCGGFVTAAGATDGQGVLVFWLLALVMQFAVPFMVTRLPVWRARHRVPVVDALGGMSPAHLVERHGLLLIIVLGESVIAIGAGVDDGPLDAATLASAILTLSIIAGLWWSYFVRDAGIAQRALVRCSPSSRFRTAMLAYYYAFIPMLVGVAIFAAGVKKAIPHATEHSPISVGIALGGGVALYLAGNISFRLAISAKKVFSRVIAAAVSLASAPIGVHISPLAQLAVISTSVATLIAFESCVRADSPNANLVTLTPRKQIGPQWSGHHFPNQAIEREDRPGKK